MRFKLVPDLPADPAESDDRDGSRPTVDSDGSARVREFVAEAQRAVPLVPGSENDCCTRLMRRLDLPSRDVARTWLTFLRALELVEETPRGFRRRETDPDPDHLRDALRRRVFGAREALATLRAADGPVAADEAFERFRDRVPTWEHHKNPDEWAAIWRDRLGTVLDWLVAVGLAERRDGGYVASDAG